MPPFDRELADVYEGVVVLTGIAPLILSIAALCYWWSCRYWSRIGVAAPPVPPATTRTAAPSC